MDVYGVGALFFFLPDHGPGADPAQADPAVPGADITPRGAPRVRLLLLLLA